MLAAHPIDTESPAGRFSLHTIGAVAELEQARIIERTKAGVAAAARDGRLPSHSGLGARDAALTQSLPRRGKLGLETEYATGLHHGFLTPKLNVLRLGTPLLGILQKRMALIGLVDSSDAP